MVGRKGGLGVRAGREEWEGSGGGGGGEGEAGKEAKGKKEGWRSEAGRGEIRGQD